MTPYDALCVGETMVMVTPTPGDRLASDATCVLRAGGAESTVAMYLAGLGHRTAWASLVGDDPLGDLLLEQVAAAGVDTTFVQRTTTRQTGVYFKDPQPGHTRVWYYRRESAAAGMDPAFGARLGQVPARFLHLSGITAALSPSCAEMVESLLQPPARLRRLVSFDVNYRPALWPDPGRAAADLLRLALAADVVFVGLDEASRLWGTTTAAAIRELVAAPPTLVVKDGAVEATAFHADDVAVAPALPVDVVEPTGAGDAFAAGWLGGALRGLDQHDRLRLGHVLAGVALRSIGDYAPPPTPDEIAAALGPAWREG